MKKPTHKGLETFKKDFKGWCGFDLEATEQNEIIEEIKSRQWQMECDLNKQAKGLEKRLTELLRER